MPFPTFTPTVPELVHWADEQFGPRTFLVVDGQRLTYTEAEIRSARVARGLLAQGVGKGSRVGLLLPNSVDFVIMALAAARVGAVIVPINTFYKASELRTAVSHADLTHLFVRAEFLGVDYAERLEAAFPDLGRQTASAPLFLADAPFLRAAYVCDADQPGWSSGDESWLVATGVAAGVTDEFLAAVERCVVPGDPAVIIYTSGSTSEPKGVVHSHGALVRHACNSQLAYPMTSDDVLFSSMPFFWIGGLVTSLLETMHVGNELVTMSAFEAGAALDVMEQERVTIALGWPHQGKTLSEHPSFAARDRSSIKRSSLIGLALPENDPPEFNSTSLGMTEMCSIHLLWDQYDPLTESQVGAFGKSPDGIEHKVIDPDTGATLATGVVGELCVRGYALMLGLHRREREDVFDADGWYHTGDAGHFDDDGWFYFAGRLTEMVKTPGGANVTPSEVEAVLMGQPDVLEAYVTGIPAPDTGQLVVAAVVPRGGATVDADELRERVKVDLAAFKVPTLIWVCAKSELPFLDSGKIKKQELAARIAERFAPG
jgi:acyl-CoA synthetase (AMP-forming)/AMP-acid ligase II